MTEPKPLTTHEIVQKLIGPVEPVGCSTIDAERYENLEQLVQLFDAIYMDLHSVASSADSHEHSVSKAGKLAKLAIETNPDDSAPDILR